MHHDPRVRQGVALALGAGAEQELAHRRGQAHADRGDVVGDVVHGVVDRHAGVDGAARAELMCRKMSASGSSADSSSSWAQIALAFWSRTSEPRKTMRSLQQPLVDVVVEAVARAAAVELRPGHGDRAGVLVHVSDPSRHDGHIHGICAAVRQQRIRPRGSVRTSVRTPVQPVQQRQAYVGMVEQVEVVGAGHVQRRRRPGTAARPRVGRRPGGPAGHPAPAPPAGPRVRRGGPASPDTSRYRACGSAGARPGRGPRSRSRTPTERWSRIRPKAAVSGSRARPAAAVTAPSRRAARRGAASRG